MWKMSDEEFIYLYRQGEEQALDALLDAYALMIRKLAYQYCFKGYRADLDDYMQLAKIKLLQAVDAYCPQKEAKFSTFYKEIVKRSFIDYARRQSVRCKRVASFTDLMIEDQEVAYSVTTQQLDIKKEDLSVKLSQFDAKDQKIVYLRIQGYSYQEIADKLHVKRRRVAYVIYKARTLQDTFDYTSTL